SPSGPTRHHATSRTEATAPSSISSIENSANRRASPRFRKYIRKYDFRLAAPTAHVVQNSNAALADECMTQPASVSRQIHVANTAMLSNANTKATVVHSNAAFSPASRASKKLRS